MDNLADPIKILLIGGYGVGKTSFMRRVTGCPFLRVYKQTTGIEESTLRVELLQTTSISISIVDVGANLLCKHPGSTMSLFFAGDVDAVIVMADGDSMRSLVEIKRWLSLVATQGNCKALLHLVIHKADLYSDERKFSPASLSGIVRESVFSDWSWTVGCAEFGDVDLGRGEYEHQRSPDDVIRKIVHSILLKRRGNVCKLLPTRLLLKFVESKNYDFEDIDKYFAGKV